MFEGNEVLLLEEALLLKSALSAIVSNFGCSSVAKIRLIFKDAMHRAVVKRFFESIFIKRMSSKMYHCPRSESH